MDPVPDTERQVPVDTLERRAPYPGQRYRHGWIPVSGFNLLGRAQTQDDLESSYGAAYDSAEFSPGAHVELSEIGDVHIDLAGEQPDTFHVFGDMSQEGAAQLSDDIWWALNRAAGDGGHRPPDPVNGLSDWVDRDGVIVGYTPGGDIRLGWPRADDDVDVLDLPAEEAKALARKLAEFADINLDGEEGE